MFQIAPGLFKNKTELLFVSINFWKRNRSKAFGPKFFSNDRKRFVSIQNFVSKTNIFDFFWNESSKTKAFDLERTLV
jgi:capsule polysaccharide export protein KpsC/LpsZ